MAGERRRLRGHALHEVAVAHEREGAVVDEILAEPVAQMRLGEGHPDARGEALTEGPGRGLDAQVLLDLGMTCGGSLELPEVLEIVERHGESTEMEQRIQQHRGVAVGEDEAITIRPRRIPRVDREILPPQHRCDVCHTHRCSGMPRIRTLHGVHGQESNGVGDVLLDHSPPFSEIGATITAAGPAPSC